MAALLAIAFVFLTAFVAALFARAAFTATAGRGASDRTVRHVLVVVFVGWLLIPAILASAGALDRYNPLPAPGLALVLLVTVGTIVLAVSPFGLRLATGLPLAGLVGFQAFRVMVELLLHLLYLEGTVPEQMTYAGRNFDIVSGVTGAALGFWLASGRFSRGLVLAWNIVALGLLANIVTIAVLSTPVPFRHFMNEPPNLLPSTFPYVWLPTFLVQAALFGHLLVFRALRRR